jgi:hypothetical protein
VGSFSARLRRAENEPTHHLSLLYKLTPETRIELVTFIIYSLYKYDQNNILTKNE